MQVAEVAAYECKMRVVHNVAFRILVLVEAQQPAAVFQAGQYLARMSSSTKRYVYIRAVRTDVHCIYARHQQYGDVICCFFFHHLLFIAYFRHNKYFRLPAVLQEPR